MHQSGKAAAGISRRQFLRGLSAQRSRLRKRQSKESSDPSLQGSGANANAKKSLVQLRRESIIDRVRNCLTGELAKLRERRIQAAVEASQNPSKRKKRKRNDDAELPQWGLPTGPVLSQSRSRRRLSSDESSRSPWLDHLRVPQGQGHSLHDEVGAFAQYVSMPSQGIGVADWLRGELDLLVKTKVGPGAYIDIFGSAAVGCASVYSDFDFQISVGCMPERNQEMLGKVRKQAAGDARLGDDAVGDGRGATSRYRTLLRDADLGESNVESGSSLSAQETQQENVEESLRWVKEFFDLQEPAEEPAGETLYIESTNDAEHDGDGESVLQDDDPKNEPLVYQEDHFSLVPNRVGDAGTSYGDEQMAVLSEGMGDLSGEDLFVNFGTTEDDVPKDTDDRQGVGYLRYQKLATKLLTGMRNSLKEVSWCGDAEVLRNAKVPILTFKYGLRAGAHDSHCRGLAIDLSVDEAAVRYKLGKPAGPMAKPLRKNPEAWTELFGDRVSKDGAWPAAKPVVMLLKVLLAQAKLDKPFTGGLGSFRMYVLLASVIEAEEESVPSLATDAGVLLLKFLERYSDHGAQADELIQFAQQFGSSRVKALGMEVDMGHVFRWGAVTRLFRDSLQALHDMCEVTELSNTRVPGLVNRTKTQHSCPVPGSTIRTNVSVLTSLIDVPDLERRRRELQEASCATLDHLRCSHQRAEHLLMQLQRDVLREPFPVSMAQAEQYLPSLAILLRSAVLEFPEATNLWETSDVYRSQSAASSYEAVPTSSKQSNKGVEANVDEAFSRGSRTSQPSPLMRKLAPIIERLLVGDTTETNRTVRNEEINVRGEGRHPHRRRHWKRAARGDSGLATHRRPEEAGQHGKNPRSRKRKKRMVAAAESPKRKEQVSMPQAEDSQEGRKRKKKRRRR